ncbi:unnamed protein product [Wickerhamomyces anomalus]
MVDSKNQSVQNFENTITCFKQFLNNSNLAKEQEFISCKLAHPKHHQLGIVKVNDRSYEAVQVYAMFLGYLKQQIINNGVNIGKCVISVPGSYTPHERELVLIAASLVGLGDVDLCSEVLASGLTYAVRNHEGDVAKKHVIVDVGYSQMTISLLKIGERKVEVEKSFIDDSIGGRVIDKVICDQLLQKVGLKFDVHSKPYQRVLKECEKFKKVLSANNIVSVNIESIKEDKDIITRPLKFESVQLIGGSSRIPSIKNLISQGFKKELSTTLNQDEAISLGCAYLSSVFTKKLEKSHFELKDFNHHTITISIGDNPTHYDLFHKNRQIPQRKFIDVEVLEDFTIEAKTKHKSLGKWFISNFNPEAPSLVRINAELSADGMIKINSVYQGEVNTQSRFSKMFTKKNEFEPLNELKVKKLPLFVKKQLHHFKSVEISLEKNDNEDKVNKETKNQLESKIYRTRDRLNEEQLAKIGKFLDEIEDWLLYGDGEDAPTAEYRTQIQAMDEALTRL